MLIAERERLQEIAGVKESAEKDLEAAKPAMDAAVAALNSITPKDIASLKALKNPPDVVKRIFDCVLLLRCADLLDFLAAAWMLSLGDEAYADCSTQQLAGSAQAFPL